jgi:hypothetical protein
MAHYTLSTLLKSSEKPLDYGWKIHPLARGKVVIISVNDRSPWQKAQIGADLRLISKA